MLYTISRILAAAAFALPVTAQTCPSGLLCCHRLFYEETPKSAAIIEGLGVLPSSAVYPVAMGCFPTDNPPNNVLVGCPSPHIQAAGLLWIASRNRPQATRRPATVRNFMSMRSLAGMSDRGN
ncbi:hypothetical protein EDC04DRAFT_2603899 [Pisolithus marmoratus]|nr:hypothetical protein EDC04DRAFT_2603899 [Pisolithus marmoratus]